MVHPEPLFYMMTDESLSLCGSYLRTKFRIFSIYEFALYCQPGFSFSRILTKIQLANCATCRDHKNLTESFEPDHGSWSDTSA